MFPLRILPTQKAATQNIFSSFDSWIFSVFKDETKSIERTNKIFFSYLLTYPAFLTWVVEEKHLIFYFGPKGNYVIQRKVTAVLDFFQELVKALCCMLFNWLICNSAYDIKDFLIFWKIIRMFIYQVTISLKKKMVFKAALVIFMQ